MVGAPGIRCSVTTTDVNRSKKNECMSEFPFCLQLGSDEYAHLFIITYLLLVLMRLSWQEGLREHAGGSIGGALDSTLRLTIGLI